MRRLFRLKRIVLGTGVMTVVSFGFWLWSGNTLPPLDAPTWRVPSPNALDYYVAAARAIVGRGSLGWAVEGQRIITVKQVGNPTASAPGAMAPAAGIKAPPPVFTTTQTVPCSLDYRRSLVARNALALRTLRKGFAYDYRTPPLRHPFAPQILSLSDMRDIGNMLTLEAQVNSSDCRWSEAMSSYTDTIRVGEDVPRGAGVVDMIGGLSLQACGRAGGWDVVRHLSAGQARAVARKMERITSRHVPYWQVLDESKWRKAILVRELFRQRRWRGYTNVASITGGEGAMSLLWEDARVLTIGQQRIVSGQLRYYDRFTQFARRPYAERLPFPRVPKDPISQVMLPAINLDFHRFREITSVTENALLTVTLALRAYRLEHGAYPTSLASLVPRYLHRLPEDPFALSGSLGYRRNAGSYVLYSVGPDGKDNHGKPITCKPRPHSKDRYEFTEVDKGDVVAGVNKRSSYSNMEGGRL